MKAVSLGLALVCFVLAGLYAAGTLQFAASTPGPHVKHAILLAVLGALSLIWFRFQSNATSSR